MTAHNCVISEFEQIDNCYKTGALIHARKHVGGGRSELIRFLQCAGWICYLPSRDLVPPLCPTLLEALNPNKCPQKEKDDAFDVQCIHEVA